MTGDDAFFRHAVTGPIEAAVLTENYLAGEETGTGAFINCF